MANEDQKTYWNDRAGLKWAAMQERLDAMLSPATAVLMDALGDVAGQHVLDIGCGTGETAMLAAARGAKVTGVDLSQPMLEAARARGIAGAEFLEADMGEYRAAVPFDGALSRFGIMFFDDPVAAFTNIHANLRGHARLTAICWQSPKVNDWAMVPAMAVKPLLPEAPPTDPHAPGPFAFADSDRVQGILTAAGFSDVTLTPHTIAVSLNQDGGLEAATDFACQIGPGAAAMAELDEAGRQRAREAIRNALAPHVDAQGRVTLGAGIWCIGATA